MLGFILIAYTFGVASGLIFGRLFCDWHHKGATPPPPPENGVKHEFGGSCCQSGTSEAGSIGEEMERDCSPGCCDKDE